MEVYETCKEDEVTPKIFSRGYKAMTKAIATEKKVLFQHPLFIMFITLLCSLGFTTAKEYALLSARDARQDEFNKTSKEDRDNIRSSVVKISENLLALSQTQLVIQERQTAVIQATNENKQTLKEIQSKLDHVSRRYEEAEKPKNPL